MLPALRTRRSHRCAARGVALWGDGPQNLVFGKLATYLRAAWLLSTGRANQTKASFVDPVRKRKLIPIETSCWISLLDQPFAIHRGNVRDPKDFYIYPPLTPLVPDDCEEVFRLVPSIRVRVR